MQFNTQQFRFTNIISTFTLQMTKFHYRKAVQSLNLLASWQGGELNKMKALKLLWLADRYHLRQYGRTILNDKYVAMENGPVASITRDILQSNAIGAGHDAVNYAAEYLAPAKSKWFYSTINAPNEKVFSKTDLEVLALINNTYGHLDQFQLRDLTHSFPEWKRWEEGILQKKYKLHPMDYNDFFINVNDDYKLFADNEKITELTKKIFSRQPE